MNLPRYTLLASSDFERFDFISEGPNGRVLKAILFTAIEASNYYNLGFGDYDPESDDINDLAVTANGDTTKILATVAQAVSEFLMHHPLVAVVAQGSTPARTRLYRMAISQNWQLISQEYEVWGLSETGWEPFQRNRECLAFLVRRK